MFLRNSKMKRSRFIIFALGFLFALGAYFVQHITPSGIKLQQANAAGTVTIYKAPQKGKAQKLLKDGFLPVDFPYAPGDADGNAYFAGPNDRSIAEEYNLSYKEGILEVAIDQATYDSTFKPLERRYDVKNGRARMELPVPQRLFPTLNKFPRVLK
jgi:hypothetical protein